MALTGTGFVAPVTVRFGGAASSKVTATSSAKVTATVPGIAATGRITVTTTGGTATSAQTFTVVPGAVVLPASGPPTTATTTRVTLSGLAARQAVELYVDTTEVQLVVTDATGGFSVAVKIPASALPGTHWITAVGRGSSSAAQVPFVVPPNWTRTSFEPAGSSSNPYDNVLAPASIAEFAKLWRTPAIASALSTPTVVNGVVYATFGDGSIRAFSASTGAQRWRRATGGTTMFSSPTVVGGVL